MLSVGLPLLDQVHGYEVEGMAVEQSVSYGGRRHGLVLAMEQSYAVRIWESGPRPRLQDESYSKPVMEETRRAGMRGPPERHHPLGAADCS